MTVKGISIDRIVGGKFVETWESYDTLGAMQQLGLIPRSGRAGITFVAHPSMIIQKRAVRTEKEGGLCFFQRVSSV